MRVSGFEKYRLTQYFLSDIQSQAAKKSQQISTGKHFFKVSDDPVRVNRSMMVDASENRIIQFQSNIQDAKGLLEFIDTNYGKTVANVQQIQETALRAANGTYTQQDRDVMADSIEQMIQQIVGYANSSFMDRHVFSGEMTDTTPLTYTGAAVTYNGNAATMKISISNQMEMDVSQTADTVYAPLITELINLRDQIQAGNHAGIEASMVATESLANEFVDNRSRVGVQLESIDFMNEAYEQTKIDLAEKRKSVEDVDLAEVVTDYTYLQNRYQASIQAQLKMMQNTILNYL
jgi:flagellar hook-associated protein 3 FlgL